MQKLFFLFVLSCLFTLTQAQDDVIIWSEDNPLSWENYLAPPIESMPMNAMTSARATIEMTSSEKEGEVTINYDVKTAFFPNDSWATNKSNELAFLLEHEQLHFDIAELFTRKLRRALKEYDYSKDYADVYQGLYNHFVSQRNEYQAKFDLDTNHGGNLKEQKKWAKKIAKELKDLSDYEKTSFSVTFTSALPVEEAVPLESGE